ncbi:hypothetical protein DCC85_01175 [Paenibacillus sp. CAA11]|nr:hypothetical protein DCC85_01175 [Paenibacillus sp. CAA11]
MYRARLDEGGKDSWGCSSSCQRQIISGIRSSPGVYDIEQLLKLEDILPSIEKFISIQFRIHEEGEASKNKL